MKFPWLKLIPDVPENDDAVPTREQMAEMLWASILAAKYMKDAHERGLPYKVGEGASFRMQMDDVLRGLHSCYEMVLRGVSPSEIRWSPPDTPEVPDDKP